MVCSSLITPHIYTSQLQERSTYFHRTSIRSSMMSETMQAIPPPARFVRKSKERNAPCAFEHSANTAQGNLSRTLYNRQVGQELQEECECAVQHRDDTGSSDFETLWLQLELDFDRECLHFAELQVHPSYFLNPSQVASQATRKRKADPA